MRQVKHKIQTKMNLGGIIQLLRQQNQELRERIDRMKRLQYFLDVSERQNAQIEYLIHNIRNMNMNFTTVEETTFVTDQEEDTGPYITYVSTEFCD